MDPIAIIQRLTDLMMSGLGLAIGILGLIVCLFLAAAHVMSPRSAGISFACVVGAYVVAGILRQTLGGA